eukprot:4728659-Pyramimonas_sp.AAC.1
MRPDQPSPPRSVSSRSGWAGRGRSPSSWRWRACRRACDDHWPSTGSAATTGPGSGRCRAVAVESERATAKSRAAEDPAAWTA